MKKVFLFICLTFLFSIVYAQKLEKVTLTREAQVEMFNFAIDNGVSINVTKDGSITEWGTEVVSDRNSYLTRLEKYMGRVEYYSDRDNESFRGKVKYIGMTAITYYGTYDKEEFRGKVRSIGTTIFEYYSKNENESLGGLIKTVGSMGFVWYSTFDNVAFRGKLKTVGITNLTYYASYDDKAIQGKVKSIDRAVFTYYTSNEKRELSGILKSGNPLQTINGIKFYIKF